MTTYPIVAVIAYLLGSIPFGYILVRVFRGEDVRAVGSGNIGATNVARTGHKGLAIATLLLDAAKGFLPVFLARSLMWGKDLVYCSRWADFACGWPDSYATSYYLPSAIAAAFAIIGHMFPVWLKFRGGKGVATAVGAFMGLAPHSLSASFLLFLCAVAATRIVSIGSVLAAFSFPLFVWLFNTYLANLDRVNPEPRMVPPPAIFSLIVFCSVLIILKHHENIRRLLAGTEHRFELKRTGA